MKISENKTKHVSPLITGFLILAAIIVTIGSLYYRYAINSYGIQVNNQLSAIADLKVGQIEQWRQERLVDATIVYRNAGFSDLVKRYFQDPKDKDVIKSIRSLMQLVYRSESFDAVSLLDTFYARKIDFPESAKRYNPVVSRQSAALMRSKKQVVFEDFYQRDAQQIFLDVFVPILDNDDSTRIIGVFEMRINPKDNIYPMLNAWPTPSKTAEILILRREGDEIVYLKGPEISKNELLKQRIPVSGTIGDGENEAASGKNKIIEGLDSHGIPVIAAVRSIKNSSWFLVACISQAEAFAPIKGRLWVVVSIIVLMLLSIGAIFSFIWKNRSERFYKDRFELVSKLHESEKHFQLLFDTIPDAIFIRDFEGHFLLVNSTACTRLGYSSEELLTITARDICAPKFVAGLEERIEKSNKNTQTVMETEHLSKDGRVIATELINRVIWYGDKQAVLVVARDITERKWADRERRVMYEITHGATTTANLDEFLNLVHRSLKKVIYAENFFVALYNKNTGLFSFPYFADKYDEAPPPLPLHKSCTAYIFRKGIPLLISADLFEKLKEQNEVELIGTNSPSWLGVPLRTPAGTIGVLVLQHYEEANIYNERDLQFLESVGNQIAVAIERKKAEDALRESELNLNVILESTADGILAIDNEGKTIKTNKRFAELWSVPQPLIEAGVAFGADKSLLNFAVAQLNDPEDFVAKVQQISETVDYDMDMFNLKDGRIFERFSAPLLMRGSSIGRVWSFRDITDRIIAEQEIKKRNEQLSQVNAEKDKFFSIIAHDLKSPFTGLLGMTEMMAAEDDDITKAELLKFGKEMHGAVLTIFRLIENLLDWAQMQKGSISFAPEPLCLQTVVSQSVELAKQRALQKGISIINDVPETVKIEADKLMVGTILRNLISNAVKFTKREGIITVSATAKGNGMIEVSVRDTGVGMNKDVMGKLFKLEEKISSTGTDGERSNGLGLLLCKEFVQRHGGSIYAKSELGKGSVFSFTIPMAG